MRRRTAWVLVAAVAAVAVGAAAVGGLALLLRGQAPLGGGDGYLYYDLAGDIPDHPPSSDLGTFLEGREPSLRALVEGLDRAAEDADVKAVVLRIGFLTDAGWGKVQELREAIRRFRASGKPAYAYLEFCGNKEYYLASGADKVYALPSALIDVTGLATEVTFFRGTLDKLGVQAQFEGIGRFKNAPNQFTETGFTEAHREQMESLVESLYEQYLTAIAEGRGKSRDEVQTLLDQGPYDGAAALKAGLVDELLYEDQLADRFEDARKISPSRYVRAGRGFRFDGRVKMALIYAVGEIVPGESQSTPFGGALAGSDTLAAALREARDDHSIKAILLRVDSPGGSGTASEAIWREVELARKQKPVVVSMGDSAASGGYYIAMGADAIVAQPGTITGSIGVFGGKFSLRGLYDKLGVSKEVVARGRHAGMFSEYRPWTDEERERIRGLLEAFYVDFVNKVAKSRDKSYEEAHAVAQGRVWTGEEALRHGLVDRLGGLGVAVEAAKQKAKIDRAREVRLVVLPERKGLLETLLERQEEGVESAIPSDLRALLRWATVLGDGRPLARLPFELRVR